MGEELLDVGSPCPAGCTLEWPSKDPERLHANVDGELSCPDCWNVFGFVPVVGDDARTQAIVIPVPGSDDTSED
jgi:hypothetical protein